MTQPAQHQGKLIYSSAPWKIYEQDAGMGERDYAVIINDIFYCRTDDSQTAMKIVESIRSHPAHSLEDINEKIEHMKKHMTNLLEEYPDQYHMVLVSGMLKHLDELRRIGR